MSQTQLVKSFAMKDKGIPHVIKIIPTDIIFNVKNNSQNVRK